MHFFEALEYEKTQNLTSQEGGGAPFVRDSHEEMRKTASSIKSRHSMFGGSRP